MEPLFADQFTVSVKVVDAVVCAASLPVPVTVTVYAPAVVPALLTVTLAVPLAESPPSSEPVELELIVSGPCVLCHESVLVSW